MKRSIEWILAGIGAIMCIGGAASIWVSQTTSSPPGFSLWLMPALLLIYIALLGAVGFFGIALEPHQLSIYWGVLVWVACGGLLALSILGAMSVSVIVLLAIPALVFGGRQFWLTDAENEKYYPI